MTQNKSHLRQFAFPLWLVGASLTALLLAFILGAAMFRHISLGGNKLPESIAKLVSALAEGPSLIKQATYEIIHSFKNDPTPLLISKEKVWGPNWDHKFPAPEDNGYLLLSGLNPQKKQSTVQLIRVADGSVVAEWAPDWDLIHSKISSHRWGAPKGSVRTYRAIHPLLLGDGSLIFNTGTSLIRLPLCSSAPDWVINFPYHHSVELAPDGESIWVPSVTEKFFTEHPFLKEKLRDDSLAQVDLQGRVLKNLSFSKILVENGFSAQLLGTNGPAFNNDPIHINQITPAKIDTPYWNRGDLLISARHLSTIYLYRPSTGKIIWHQQGHWLNQHSAHFVKNYAIAVFGNDIYSGNVPDPFITPEKRNSIYLYDFRSRVTNQVHPEILDKLKPKTVSQGRVRVLDDASTFIEETDSGRLIKIDAKGQVQWSYVNVYDDKHLGSVAWSRYITRQELETNLEFSAFRCN